MDFEYDSYNRIQRMTYPDGEVVSYGYNAGGMLQNITGVKNNASYKYVDSIGYNEFEMKAAVNYGNGTHVHYTYDVLQRLIHLRSETASGEYMQDIDYSYDSVGNIIEITNNAGMLMNGLGGKYRNTYRYDNLYRLEHAGGYWDGHHNVDYELDMKYLPNGRVSRKNLHGNTYAQTPYSDNQTPVNYNNHYHYTNTNQPNTLTYIDNGSNQSFRWDVKGNMTTHFDNDMHNSWYLCWDEQNRLNGVRDKRYLSYYQYDANGDRVYKLTGQSVRQNRNGERSDYYLMGRPMLYASPYLVSDGKHYTKHYYAETERIASRIGGGGLSDINMCDNIEMFVSHRNSLDIHFERVLTCLNAHAYMDEHPLEKLSYWQVIREQESNCYWYHPDHLGSSSWITYTNGKAVQHLHYLPWGEDFVDQRSTDWNAMYTFSAKEKDTETGYSYFGARYYSSDLSIWLSVDPMSDKYPSLSPYVYCANNPIKLVDPNGEDIWEIDEEGRIVNHDNSYTDHDIVYKVDKNKNRIEGQFVVLDYKSIEKQKSISYSPDGKTVDTYDLFQVRGDDNGKKLFEFMAQAVSDAGIEVSHIQCGVEGKKGLNFITCAHERPSIEIIDGNSYTVSSEKSGWYLFIGRLNYGYTIRTWNHSHPQSTNASDSDLSLKETANNIFQQSRRQCPKYNIYHVPSKLSIPY